jgi:hypothetical protein
MNWFGGIVATLVFWMCLGLLYQVRDLWRCWKSHPQLDRERRCGVAFEMIWRLGIIFLFGLHALLAILLDRGVFVLREKDEMMGEPSAMICEAIFELALLTVIASIPFIRKERKRTRLHGILYFIFCLLAMVLCLERWTDLTLIPLLVHIATVGIDYATANKFSIIDARLYPARVHLFFWWSLASGLVVCANGFILVRLAKQWSRGLLRRLTWIALFCLGVAFTASFAAWILARGLGQISPYFAEVGCGTPWQGWIAAAVVAILLATTLAYRMSVEREVSGDIPAVYWRVNSRQYFHEWRLILFLIAAAFLSMFIIESYRSWVSYQGFASSFGLVGLQPKPFVSFLFLDAILSRPNHFLSLALLLVLAHRFFRRRPKADDLQIQTPRLNPAKFITLWLATAAFVVSGSLALVWMSFGLWFNPWFGGK